MREYIVLIVVISLLVTGCHKETIKYEEGTYVGQGEGHHGLIRVEVIVESSKITEIKVIEDYEIPGLREIVYKQLPKRIIKANTWEVDAISGATLTSEGLKEAVEDALKDAVVKEDRVEDTP